MQKLHDLVDPYYVQMPRLEAALLLGRSISEFDRLRNTDPRFPAAIKSGRSQTSKVRFRLSDLYAYSETLINEGEAANKEFTASSSSAASASM